jgi:hypothetical protein
MLVLIASLVSGCGDNREVREEESGSTLPSASPVISQLDTGQRVNLTEYWTWDSTTTAGDPVQSGEYVAVAKVTLAGDDLAANPIAVVVP